jgi:hypothetical protein
LANTTNIASVSGGSLNIAGDSVYGGMQQFNNALTNGPPTFTTRSVGTRVNLYPNIGSSTLDSSIGVDSSSLWFSSLGAFKWYSNSTTPTMTITSGNVGIGTTNPGTTLDLVGTARFTTSITTANVYSTNVTSTNAVFTNNTKTNSVITNVTSTNNILTNAIITNQTATNILATNETITSLSSTSSTLGSVLVTNVFSASFNSNTIGSLFTTGGNIGIGTTSPGYAFDVKGNVRINTTTFSLNATVGALISAGGISIVGTNASANSVGGALTVAGGLAVSQDSYIGGSLYVNNVNHTMVTGLSTIGSFSNTGVYQVSVSIGKTMPNTNYKVIGKLQTTTSNMNVYNVSFSGLTTTGFTANILRLDALGSGWIDTNLNLSWVVYP